MKGRRRLRNPLASPAGELLPNILHDLPLPRTTSSVSVTSSPSLASLVEPQQAQTVGPGTMGTMTRSRGRWAGNGLRDGLLRIKAQTAVVLSFVATAARAHLRRSRL